PFAGVDPIAVEDIQTVVARLKYRNIGILITDHNVNETLSICDRAYLLIDGKIFKHGTAEELAADEQVRRLYLGRNFELKRKDYLHEEVQKGITLDNLIISVENAIEGIEKMEEDNEIREREGVQITGRPLITVLAFLAGDTATNEDESIGVAEYARFIQDTKNALIEFAKKNKKVEILKRSELLLVEDRDLRADLEYILLLLKAEQK
ncbi:MAG TPA: hypothetical protein VFV08_03460, partial [Puia sp.]|nr:hypothetical protein [Puia sp.]